MIWRGENKFFAFFAFKQAKEQFLFQVQPLNMFFLLIAHFRVTVKIFWGPATSEKATFRHGILELGSYNILAQYRMCGFFIFLNRSTLLYSTVH